jgi:hypothetical protein
MRETDVRWLALCSAELQLRRKLSESTDAAPRSSEHRKLLREWWASVESLLDFAVKNHHREIPLELLNAFRGFSGYLAVGKIPGPIEDARSEGASPPGPSERRDIGLAVAYLMAATGGLDHLGARLVIDDRSPVKTVGEMFGVARSTVQGWRNKYPQSGLGVTPIDAPILKSLMRKAGKRYCSAGRSQAAIRKRGPRN